MKQRAFFVGATVAAVVGAVVVALIVRRAGQAGAQEEIPALIQDCFERVRQIESELHRLAPVVETLG